MRTYELTNRTGQIIARVGGYSFKDAVEDAHEQGFSLVGLSAPDADISNACFSEIDFTNADFSSTEIWYSRCHKTNFTGANLAGASFHESELIGAILVNANLDRVDLSWCDLTHAVLDGASIGHWGTVKRFVQYPQMGSRYDYLHVFITTEDTIIFQTGCFWGALQAFEDAVYARHRRNPYGQAYQNIINEFKPKLVV